MNKDSGQSDKEMTLQEIGGLVVQLVKKTTDIESSIDSLAASTNKGFAEVHERIDNFQHETAENFKKVRQDTLSMHDRFATKDELGRVMLRVISLEGSA